MDSHEIKDRNSAFAWLKARPKSDQQPDAISLVQRAACRVFPVFAGSLVSFAEVQRSQIAQVILRSLLTAGVALKFPTPQIKKAALAARVASEIDFDKDSTVVTVLASRASRAVYASGGARATLSAVATITAYEEIFVTGSVWTQVAADAQLIESGVDLSRARLWSHSESDWFKSANEITRMVLANETSSGSDFWLRWWDGVLTGEHIPWPIQREIALIPNKEWDKGPAHLATLIAEIELNYAIEQTPNAEILRANPETGLIYAEPVSQLRESHLDDAADTMLDCAAIFDGQGGANGPYAEMVAECDLLRDAHSRYRQRPLMLYRVAKRVIARTMIKEGRGDVPKGDAYVQDFFTTLSGVVGDLMAFDTDIREAETLRGKFEGHSVQPEDAGIAATAQVVAPVTTGHLHEELIVDAGVLRSSTDVELRSEARYNIKSRLLRIFAIVKNSSSQTVAHVEKYPVIYGTVATTILTILGILLG